MDKESMYALGLYDEVLEKLQNDARVVDLYDHYDKVLVDDCIYIDQLRREFRLINETPISKEAADFRKFEIFVEAMRLGFSVSLLGVFFPDETESIKEAREHIEHLKSLSPELQTTINETIERNRNGKGRRNG
ncbi:MAG: hypothetical protein MRZ32_02855 [Bacteroidales bacterium]|nr:hypothetical protein [Bacteroidales bacterium]